MMTELRTDAGDFGEIGRRLRALLAEAGLPSLNDGLIGQFETYLGLILRWNEHMNLTAVRDVDGILSRHFVESIACLEAVPRETKTLLDYGSGAGFPGIPIALCRPEIAVMLAESQSKKAAFLQEAVRGLGLRARVYAGRAETLKVRFDCVAMRAVDRMEKAVRQGSLLVESGGSLVLMTTGAELPALRLAAGASFIWDEERGLAGGTDRIIAVGRRVGLFGSDAA